MDKKEGPELVSPLTTIHSAICICGVESLLAHDNLEKAARIWQWRKSCRNCHRVISIVINTDPDNGQ